jgi:hypothetical protein
MCLFYFFIFFETIFLKTGSSTYCVCDLLLVSLGITKNKINFLDKVKNQLVTYHV